jgi:Fibronectin type III domain
MLTACASSSPARSNPADKALSVVDVLPEAPVNLKLKTTFTTASATWAAPLSAAGAKPITGYRVFVDTSDARTLSPTTTSLTLKGLEPGSWHVVQIAAVTASGQGPAAKAEATLPERKTKAKHAPPPPPPPIVSAATQAPTVATNVPTNHKVNASPAPQYVAPRVTDFQFLGCQKIPGTDNSYRRDYRVVLDGGSFWFYQNQNAPRAVMDISLVNSQKNMWIGSVSIGVGKSLKDYDPKAADKTIAIPDPYFSRCPD